jgi:hypothetical protein
MARNPQYGNLTLQVRADLDHGGKLAMDSALAQTTQTTEERLTEQMMGEINRVIYPLNDELPALQLLQRLKRSLTRSVG